jgi:hypothetical protein
MLGMIQRRIAAVQNQPKPFSDVRLRNDLMLGMIERFLASWQHRPLPDDA